jgi:DNA mismatch endonuclease (patch repair protein)
VTDKLTPERRSDNMRKIRATNTSPEMLVRRLVHSMGFRYRLHVADLPGTPDLVFPRLNKIIEVRGCFWHQHGNGKCIDSHIPKSRLDYWFPKLERNIQRDRANQQTLRKLGWKALVIWECETANPKLKKRLEKFLANDGLS